MPRQSIASNSKLMEGFLQVGLGIVGDGALPLNHVSYWDGLKFQRHQYWHAKAITATATSETLFFNANPDGVQTNVTNPKTIVGGQSAFWATHLMVDIQPGYDPDGTAQADGEPFQTDTDPATLLADYNAYLRHGILRFKVGKIEKVYRGLHNFPFGGGIQADVAQTNTNTTTVNSIGNLNNGVPMNSNKFCFTPPMEVFPDDPVEVGIKHAFARNLKDSVTVCVYLEGVLVEVV